MDERFRADGNIRCFHEMKAEWGVPQLLSLDVFDDVSKGYLVDDCCIFGAEVFVIKHTGRMGCLSMVKKPPKNVYAWRIENLSALLKSKSSKFSKAFTVQGIVWKLLLTPKEDSISKEVGLDVYPCIADNRYLTSNRKVHSECVLRVKNQLDIKNREYTVRHRFGSGPHHVYDCYTMLSSKDLRDSSAGSELKDGSTLEGETVVMCTTMSFS
ncbi:uncharacterized protein LOC120179245 [Hibiscus syriacus]|uniref:uncharacterized protein LOC120179245 n=1 Tax=Hibiscus syriacus TaxID=106335 RepID=UPI001921B5AA|nr:uncharacterized protein LOC120179245 [Hibiscus syriacus]